jgi:ribosomal protein S18 acetylase RimI-like enzyme
MIAENNKKYSIASLEKRHDKKDFNCGIDALNQYLKTQASQDAKKNVAVTYVLTIPTSEKVLGYYTLSSIGIFPGDLPNELIRKLPKYPVLPGILLGRLAVDTNCQGMNIGQYILIDALKRSLQVSSQIGINAVIVDAKNEKAVKFYEHFGFIKLPESGHRLFLPISTLQRLDLF